MTKEKKKEKHISKRSGEEGLKKVVGEVHKKYGVESVRKYGDFDPVKIDVIPTGSYRLDKALGIGGVPKGRIIEVFGPESSGKTTTALQIVANAQRLGGITAFIDAEHALDPGLVNGVGAVMDDIYISQPDYGEQALEIAEMLVRSGEFDVIVIDSVAALTPKAEIEGEMGDSNIGLQARLMSKALRKLAAAVSQTNTCIIFINQIRKKIGVMFGNPNTTPGGEALKFYSSIRLEVNAVGKIKKSEGDDTVVIGNKLKIKVVKNKLAPPFKVANTELIFGKGYNYVGEILDTAVLQGIIDKAGNSYSYGDERIGIGRLATIEEMKKSKEIFERIKADVELSEESTEDTWS